MTNEGVMIAVRPEVYAALTLAERHLKSAEFWSWRGPPWRRRRFEDKHRMKAQKHIARAEKLAGRAG